MLLAILANLLTQLKNVVSDYVMTWEYAEKLFPSKYLGY